MFKLFPTLCLLLALQPLSAQTFSSTVNQPIPDDNTTVMFDITVSGLPDLIDTFFGLEQVCLNMTHTYNEDLQVLLRAPDGKTILLFGGLGGGDDNFYNTCMSGNAPPFSTSTAPYSGTFLSYGILGNINNGQNPNGVWTLIVYDTYAFADEGFLIDWSIQFGNQPAIPYVFSSSNLPIVKLTTLNEPIADDPKAPVLMQIIDNGPGTRNKANQTDYAFEGRIMAEWQGFSGPYYPKKNYDFEIVDTQGNEMDTTILGMPKEHDWIFKAESTDPTLIKNTVTYEMARRMGGYAPRTRACEIILDGEYAGLYILTEKVKRDANRVDIVKLAPEDTTGSQLSGGYIIEMNINGDPADWTSAYLPINQATCPSPVEFKHVYPKSAAVLPQQHDYIRNYVDDFEKTLADTNFTDPATGYRNYIDVGTFIDFLIVNEFSVNYDSYGRSTYLYKEKDTDGGKLKCGPPWDYDRAMDYNSPATTSGWVWEITHPYWPFPFWWSRMWEDTVYRKELACRWTMLRQNTFQTDSFLVYIDSTASFLQEAKQRDSRIWNNLGNLSYNNHIDSLKSFVSRRLDWLDAILAHEQVGEPAVYLPADTVVCAGTVFDASALNDPTYAYNWQPGPDSSLITLSQDGVYYLKVKDIYGCYTKKAMNVSIAQPNDAGFSSQHQNGALWTFFPHDTLAQSYHWDFGDGDTSSAMNPAHTYVSGGVYLVSLMITDATGCFTQMTQESIQFTFVGTLEQTAFDGTIFPNPFKETIRIQLAAPSADPFTVTLENELGQTFLVKEFAAGTQAGKLSTAGLSTGVYALRLKMKERVWVFKMVGN